MPRLVPPLEGVMLSVSFKSEALRETCTKIEVAQGQLGPQPANELLQLLADAESLPNAGELIDFRDGEIVGGDSLFIGFGTDYRAAFVAGGDAPQGEDGGIAWGQVRRIMLVEVSRC